MLLEINKKDLEIEVKVITPEMAEKYLEHNSDNRKMRQATIATYADDMKNGRWEMTHQGIAFNTAGELVDGQHRLAAIVLSGVPIRMVITKNVTSKLNMDNHMKRSLTDTTGLSKVQIAISRIILDTLNPRYFSKRSTKFYASSSQIVEFANKYRENLDFAESSITKYHVGVRISAVRAAIFAASFSVPFERLIEFVEILSTGRYDNFD